MKKLLLKFLTNAAAIYLATKVVPGISYNGGWETLAMIAAVLALVNMFIKPLVMLLALPVEILTLGLFGLIINAAMLFLVAYLVPQFKIEQFYFSGASLYGITAGAMNIPRWGTAVIGSVLISAITGFLGWLAK